MRWLTVPLKEISDVITKGTTPTTLGYSYSASGIPFLRAENLPNGTIDWGAGSLFIDGLTNQFLSRSVIKNGDVLISIAGTIGRVGVVPSGAPLMNCNQAVAIIRLGALILPRFLMYWLTSYVAKSQMVGAKVTQTISNLSLGQIGNLVIPLPPISEQRRIVEILDEADRIRKLRREANQKAERILPALFLKMFGDPATNPKEWDVEKLGIVCEVMSGATPRTDNSNHFGDDIFWATPKDLSSLNDYILHHTERKLSENGFNNCSTRLFPKGTVLLSSRAPIGLVAIADMPICTNQGFKNLIPGSRLSSWYVFAWAVLRKDFIKSQGRGATFKEISKEIVSGFPIPVPPKALQNKFSSIMEKLRYERLNLQRSENHIDGLYHLLTQRAFDGQLTAKWCKAHMKELLFEMEEQLRLLNLPDSNIMKNIQ